MSKIRALAGLAVAILVLAPAAVGRAQTATVAITDRFEPSTLTVPVGTTVTWVNQDDERHRPRNTDGPDDWDSGNLEPGESYTHTFTAAGTYHYVDERDDDNSNYWATVVVTGSAPPPTTPPGGGGGGGGGAPPTSGSVTIANRAFSPPTLTIAAGGTVSWANNDDDEHTVTGTGGSFDSGTLNSGGNYSRTFPTAGTFPYICQFHSDMTGTISVTPPGGGAAPPAAPAPAPAPVPSVPPAGSADASTGPVTRGVQIVDFSFAPASLAARVGDTVTFVNAGQASHTATADGGAFDSGILARGGTFSTTLTQEGTISYLCQIHPDMTGTIDVAAGAAAAPSGASPGAGGATAGSTAAGGETAPERADVEVRDFEFAPADVTIAQGGTVAWTWAGEAPHSVTADDGSFDSDVLESGATFEQVFDDVGEFAYTCLVHPDMTGTVNVVAASVEDAAAEVATATQGASSDGGGPPSLVWGLLAGAAMLGMTGLLFVAARRLAAAEHD